MRNAARHGANRLHFLRFPQLGLQRGTVRFHFFAGSQVMGKQSNDVALCMLLKRQAHLKRHAVALAGQAGHLAQLGMAGDVLVRQGARRIGQKIGQRPPQGLFCGALKQGGGGRVEQHARFLGRIHDPLKQWKLSPMDLEARRLWEAYTKAKETMLERTHIPEAPWWVVAANDKKKARLNCITHLLNQIPYKEVDHPTITLPARVHNPDYLRGPVPPKMYVPEVY